MTSQRMLVNRSLRLRHTLAMAAVLSILTAVSVDAADCPAAPALHLPEAPFPLHMDTIKKLLRDYHKNAYIKDMTAVFAVAQEYVERRAAEVKKPAIVLDIDETSLTNWPNLEFDDFGVIKSGPCPLQRGFACGFSSWVAKGIAGVIEPARDFYNAARANHIAVFFITGRTDGQRAVTVRNLRRAGYRDWTRLVTRPDDDHNESIVPFKSGQRARIEKAGYAIIATIGDQTSDIVGGSAECGFKLPNPFYFIP